MSATTALIWVAALVAFGLVLRRGTAPARRTLEDTGRSLLRMLPLFVVALPMASLIAELVPGSVAVAWLGPESGLRGLMIASLVGGFLPGGPFVAFPVVLIFAKAGAGVAPMVALISGWSVIALHRALIWEMPLLGPRFMLLRLASASIAAPLAGILAEWLAPLFPGALAHL
jgi:uncharacterized membrane protein YraQ (UPF0718 family)